MLPRRRPSSTPSRNPSDDLSHVGRADAAKKMIICQIKERLPRIARLAHLNTQTPRTPRTPRAKNSTTTAENKRVGRRWSPPGGLQLFLVQEAADQICHNRSAGAYSRAGLIISGAGGWPRAEVTQRRRRRGGHPEEETRRKEGGGTTLKSYNPNTEGGEKDVVAMSLRRSNVKATSWRRRGDVVAMSRRSRRDVVLTFHPACTHLGYSGLEVSL